MDEQRDRIADPKKLRALAHPLRWTLLNLLMVHGKATATHCAELTGESVASCSYHLNMLAKYGYIEHAEGGQGREKPWRVTSYEQSLSDEGLDTEGTLALEAAADAFLENEFAHQRDYERRRSLLPEQWREADGITSGATFLTAAETKELKLELRATMERYYDRIKDPSTRPEGSRPVRFFINMTVEPEIQPE